VIESEGKTAKLLAEYESFLPTLFGVSEVFLKPASPQARKTTVEKAEGTKCERCWRYVPEVSSEPDRTGLCPRCVEALAEPVSL
jgi:isoleucyl-tRNA synthetase